jgi:hypothetical protein
MNTMTSETTADLNRALTEFLGAFEVMFHYDWEYTASMIGGQHPSFLKPGLTEEGESSDWGARGALLAKYRKLLAAMHAVGLRPVYPFPLDSRFDPKDHLWKSPVRLKQSLE